MEDKACRLAVDLVSLLLELGTIKDEVSALQAYALKEKNALNEAYEEGFDVIFNYGYGCCAIAHNIWGSQPVAPYGMLDTSNPLSPESFINPRCPPSVIPAEAVTSDVRPGKAMIKPKREAPATVPGTYINEAGEHLSATEVRLGNGPDFST